jgi:hypothetical protein
MKLTVADQKAFFKLDKKNVYPVPNKWGESGWTTFKITKAEREVILAALEIAYQDVVKLKGRP